MGNWQLEVGRMTLYILFPIGMYYYLNQADSIEKFIANQKKRYNMFDSKEHMEFKQFIEECNSKQQMKYLIELEAEYLKGKVT